MNLEAATVVEDGLARAQRTCVRSGASTAPLTASGATNAELDALARDLKIPNYVRCRIKDEVRGQTATACEFGIVNLQNTDQAGELGTLHQRTHQKLAY